MTQAEIESQRVPLTERMVSTRLSFSHNTDLWLVHNFNTDLWLVHNLNTDLWLVHNPNTPLWLVHNLNANLWLVHILNTDLWLVQVREPFWLGLITVLVVMLVIGLGYLVKVSTYLYLY